MSLVVALLTTLASLPAPPSRTSSVSEDGRQRASRSLVTSLGSEAFELSANELHADFGEDRYVASGDVVLKRAGSVVIADRMTLLHKERRIIAEGEVVLVEGTTVLECGRVEMELPELSSQIQRAEISVMRDTSSERLTREIQRGGPRSGRRELTVGAERIERLAPRSFEVDGGSFTPCDCGEGNAPAWRISAAKAYLDLDAGAWLLAPVFYAKEVPVFALPVLYLPLGDRRTGLLFPKPGYGPMTGFRIAEPLYFVLGRSYDATIEPSFFASRGFGGTAELRWAPWEGSRGELRGTLLADEGVYAPEDRSFERKRESALPRFAISGAHRSHFEGSTLAAELNMVGDPNYVGEFADGYLARQTEEVVSRLGYVVHGPVRVALGLQARQDLRPMRYPRSSSQELREVELFSADLPGPGAITYRLVDFRMDAPPTPLLGGALPAFGEARLSAQGFLAPSPNLPRFARVDFRPELALPLSVFGFATLEPSIAVRMTGWTGRADDRSASRSQVGLIARTDLFTEIWRSFGSVRHRIRPEISHLIIPALHRRDDELFWVGDEIDLLKRVHQVAAGVRTDLRSTANGARWVDLRAHLGRDLGLAGSPGAGTSELLLAGTLRLPIPSVFVEVGSRAGVDVDRGNLEELLAWLRVNLGSWLGFGLVAGDFSEQVPRSSFVAPEELVVSDTIDRSRYLGLDELNLRYAEGDLDLVKWTQFSGVSGTLSLRPVSSLTLGLGASFELDSPRIDQPKSADDQSTPSKLKEWRASLRWEPPCHCVDIAASLRFARDLEAPDIGVLINLARLGQVGTL